MILLNVDQDIPHPAEVLRGIGTLKAMRATWLYRSVTARGVNVRSNWEELSLSKCLPGYIQKTDIA
jgi:hypothetical protein